MSACSVKEYFILLDFGSHERMAKMLQNTFEFGFLRGGADLIVEHESNMVEGFAFERGVRAESLEGALEGALHAYLISTTIQTSCRALHASAARNKRSRILYAHVEGPSGSSLHTIGRIAQLVRASDSNSEVAGYGPRDRISLRGSIGKIGAPLSTQLNLTYFEAMSAVADPDASKWIIKLGIYRGPHLNKGDTMASLTTLSKLEEEVHLGVIVCLELVIGQVLIPLTILCALAISYKTTATIDGDGVTALAALPGNKLLMLGPELRSIYARHHCVHDHRSIGLSSPM
ncbi:hypothetical protein DFH09DRAFT_1104336 [Mycena vulgaris]|nr:hypothetical protein DFH09DRAFT_1104336 [Mycena vulgaris]